MDWLIHKYIGIVSLKLPNFKRKGSTLYNFRCPLCGDSQINTKKSRAYIYEKEGKMMFHCHNCNETLSASNFLKRIDPTVYSEYIYEKLLDSKTEEQKDFETFVDKMKKPKFLQSGPLKGLKKVSQLSLNHPIKKFVDSRKIPTPYHAKLFCCPNFMNYANQIIPNKFDEKSLMHDETRLLIPFFDVNKNLHAFQGRSLNNSKVKYITIIINDDVPKVYGLDTTDFEKEVVVLEGPIDSMFIPNSIATAGGDLVSSVGSFPKDNLTIVYDNEPRNKDTVKKIDKAINYGYKVCIWPENFEHKDVNDMILSGLTPEFISYIIKQNTYRDLSAKLALTKWRKS